MKQYIVATLQHRHIDSIWYLKCLAKWHDSNKDKGKKCVRLICLQTFSGFSTFWIHTDEFYSHSHTIFRTFMLTITLTGNEPKIQYVPYPQITFNLCFFETTMGVLYNVVRLQRGLQQFLNSGTTLWHLCKAEAFSPLPQGHPSSSLLYLPFSPFLHSSKKQPNGFFSPLTYHHQPQSGVSPWQKINIWESIRFPLLLASRVNMESMIFPHRPPSFCSSLSHFLLRETEETSAPTSYLS